MTKAMALLVTGSACLMLLAGCVNPNYTPLSKGSFTKGASAVDTSKLTLITPEMVAKNRAASALPGSTAQTLTPFVSAQPQTLDFQPVPQPAPMVDPSTVPGVISAPMQMPPMQMPPMQTPMSGGYSMGPVGMAPMGAPYGMQPMGPQMGQQIGMPPMGAPFGMQAMGPQMAPQFGMPPMAGQMGLSPMGR